MSTSDLLPPISRPLRLGILGSGKGSNARSILEAIAAGTLDAEVVLILSDIEGAGILALGGQYGVPARFLDPGKFRTKLEPAAEAEMARQFREAGAEIILGAGFMRILKAPMLEAFPNRIINIHPSLLPNFPGLAAWEQALEAGAGKTGCTVHLMDSGIDTGRILGQREVPVLPGDTAESLHARIQVAEHELYPEILRGIAGGELVI
jgi:phosphoribosylglycinamide formyltransferase-1